MPRNGSGSFVPLVNSWNPQTAGVSATAADFGALLTDLAAALTQSVSADGQTAITGNIAMGGFKLTGLAAGSATGNSVRWEQLFSQGVEADIASATTTDIGGQNTNFLRVTGTTAITSFGTNYNGPRFLRFAAALTLTHGSALILPGAANITTAAGDRAIAVPVATSGTADGWQVFYQRASLAVTSALLTQSTARMLGRTTGGTGAIEELTAANVAALLAGYIMPVGTIIDFAGDTAPTGFLACPTTATNISRTTYAALFAAIGTTWGAGDGSTTFGQPYFPEGYAAVQANANVGDSTVGEVIAHTHTVPLTSEMASGATSGALRVGSTTNTGSTGGSANLAAGLKVLKCVKYQ